MKLAPMRSISATIGLLTNLMTAAHAAPGDYRFELTPVAGYVAGGTFEDKLTDEELQLDDSSAVGFQVNIRADSQSTWEIHYVNQDTRASTPATPSLDVIIRKFEVGGTYETSDRATRPFAAATFGFSQVEPGDSTFEDDTYFSFSLGGGVKFFTDRKFGLTLDARWVAAVIDEDTDVFCVSAGGLTCLVQADAGLASQFRLFVGLNARF
ncbi:MAG: outer membrane beta-barrel protein [Woeseiaceae bacterium]